MQIALPFSSLGGVQTLAVVAEVGDLRRQLNPGATTRSSGCERRAAGIAHALAAVSGSPRRGPAHSRISPTSRGIRV